MRARSPMQPTPSSINSMTASKCSFRGHFQSSRCERLVSDKSLKARPLKELTIESVNEWENKERGIKRLPHSTIKPHIDKVLARRRSPGAKHQAVVLRKAKPPDDHSFESPVSDKSSTKENKPLPSKETAKAYCDKGNRVSCDNLPVLNEGEVAQDQKAVFKDTNLNIKVNVAIDPSLKNVASKSPSSQPIVYPCPVSFPVPMYYGGYYPQIYYSYRTPISIERKPSPIKSPANTKKEILSFDTVKAVDISIPGFNPKCKIEKDYRESEKNRATSIEISEAKCKPNGKHKSSLPNRHEKLINNSMTVDSHIPNKSPVLLTFDLSESKSQSLADLFKNQKKRLADRMEQRKANKRPHEAKHKTKEEILAQRKEMMKVKNIGSAKCVSVEIEKSPKRREPSPELLARLSSGTKFKICKEEMYKLTCKNYELLPEVKKKREMERKKEELRKRIAKMQELKKVSFIS
eukprot:TRINITY_DN4392_c0_g5_i1.p1 TRINITY_DN4392_c0_g5~~TRINITY_DN4392_c0_g5_i1.p1  ORF type:complete len:463 (+),score=47.42 TRINITY_DN4392_c0_g5_i1:78-1466(+)